MTKELKPCPFCGEIPSTGLCGERVMHDCKTLKAFMSGTAEDWNTRYKRTCNYDVDQLPEGGDVYTTCSECGWQCDIEYQPKPQGFRFCPNCGAEVVDGD